MCYATPPGLSNFPCRTTFATIISPLRGSSGGHHEPVQGAPKPIKAGTKVKGIRLTTGDHNIDCRIDGFGQMALKSEFVKKA